MNVSFFNNWTFATWIDYSNLKECIWVAKMEEIEIKDLQNWKDFELIEIDEENKSCKVRIFEWEKWDLKLIEIEKQKQEDLKNKKSYILTKLWELKNEKDWLKLLWEDLTEINEKIENLKLEYKNL